MTVRKAWRKSQTEGKGRRSGARSKLSSKGPEDIQKVGHLVIMYRSQNSDAYSFIGAVRGSKYDSSGQSPEGAEWVGGTSTAMESGHPVGDERWRERHVDWGRDGRGYGWGLC